MMSDDFPKSTSRAFWRFAFTGVFFLVVLTIVGLTLYHEWVTPSAESIATNQRRYEQLSALYAPTKLDPKTSGTLTTAPARPLAVTTQSTETLQARCDRLFLELLIAYDWFDYKFEWSTVDAKLKTALELADLYDTGVRVSPEAKSHYRFRHSDILEHLAGKIAYGDNKRYEESMFLNSDLTLRTENFPRVIKALKFIAIMDCPIGEYSAYIDLFLRLLCPDKNRLVKLPPEIVAMDLELLAPRRPVDWPRDVALFLEHVHYVTESMQKLLDRDYLYQRIVYRDSKRIQGAEWYEVAASYVNRTLEPVFIPLFQGPEQLSRMLEWEKEVQDYAESVRTSPQLTHNSMQSLLDVYPLRARLIAGGIELRRGKPIPSPEQIGPDSYFFDPVTQKAYKFYVSKAGSVVHLVIRRPCMSYAGKPQELNVMTIALPPDHPGLDKIPTLPERPKKRSRFSFLRF